MMTRQRLTDAELAAKTRAVNRQRAERRRVKLADAGHVQTVVWLTANTRQRLEAESAAAGQTLSRTVDRLLAMALQSTAAPKAEPPKPVDTGPCTAAPLAEIARLLAEGKSWQQIAEDLNARGFKTAAGAKFHKGALHRLWTKQQETQP